MAVTKTSQKGLPAYTVSVAHSSSKAILVRRVDRDATVKWGRGSVRIDGEGLMIFTHDQAVDLMDALSRAIIDGLEDNRGEVDHDP